jgi:hypothetical protein
MARIDWRLCRLQTALYAAAGLVFSKYPVNLAILGAASLISGDAEAQRLYGAALVLAIACLVWIASGLLLSAGAQWLPARHGGLWPGALLVATAAALHGPVNRSLVLQLTSGKAQAVIPSGIYMFWLALLCGGLFYGHCLLVQRSRDWHRRLAAAETERTAAEARLRETRMQALQQGMDPVLLEQSLGALRTTYAHDRAAGEELLGALVEALRSPAAFVEPATPASKKGES